MEEQHIRWKQRFSNFKKAFAKLAEAVEGVEGKTDDEMSASFSELEKEGLIQRFEYTHELAWKTMKDYLAYQGIVEVGGSRDATREAFKINLIKDGEGWMEMIAARNRTSHTYDDATAKEIYLDIIKRYFPLFCDFNEQMNSLEQLSL